MKAGDIVRCKLWGVLGVVIVGEHGPNGCLTRILWNGDTAPRLAHIAHVEAVDESR